MKKNKSAAEINEEVHEATAENLPDENVETVKSRKFSPRQLFNFIKRNPKKAAIGLAVFLILLMAIPFTRYPVLGVFIKKNVSFKFVDSQTGTPVSEATVRIRGKEAKTNNEGVANLSGVGVGESKVTVSKQYYDNLEFEVFVGLKPPAQTEHKLTSQGRLVRTKFINKISGEELKDLAFTIAGEKYKTNDSGQAIIVIPGSMTEASLIVIDDGFIKLEAKVTASDSENVEGKNTFHVTPSGKVYFLSKASGKIDVVKTNLDGTDRQTVVAGTGREEDSDTILLASRDWKYLAFKARREGDKAKLHLIETATDKLSIMDEGNASFNLVGWYNEFFVFRVERNEVQSWQSKKQALKSYNATAKKLKTLDETTGEGNDNDYASESIENFYILENLIVYAKFWQCSYYSFTCVGKKSVIASVRPDGQQKTSHKSFDITDDRLSRPYAQTKLYAPQELYFEVWQNNTHKYFEFEDEKVEEKQITSDDFNKFYPTFLVSPSGQKTFWYEPRDGKNTLFVGDNNGENGQQIASLSELKPYGWFSDDYLLVSKNQSELFILPVSGPKDDLQPIKISDYHKPYYDFTGYGYGYGGF